MFSPPIKPFTRRSRANQVSEKADGQRIRHTLTGRDCFCRWQSHPTQKGKKGELLRNPGSLESAPCESLRKGLRYAEKNSTLFFQEKNSHRRSPARSAAVWRYHMTTIVDNLHLWNMALVLAT